MGLGETHIGNPLAEITSRNQKDYRHMADFTSMNTSPHREPKRKNTQWLILSLRKFDCFSGACFQK
jgi:hypothetical protein